MALAALGVTACTTPKGPQFQGAAQGALSSAPYAQAKQVPQRARLYTISPGLIATLRSEKAPAGGDPKRLANDLKAYQYLIGPGDELTLSVWSPFKGIAAFSAETHAPQQGGAAPTVESVRSRVIEGMRAVPGLSDLKLLVQADGTVQIPYLSSVRVAGFTRAQLAQSLEKQLAKYLPFPVLDLRISAYRARSIQVTGEVAHPGIQYLNDRPLTLLDALGNAGPQTASADPRRVILVRGGKRFAISQAPMLLGDPLFNVVLGDGDIVNVPDNQDARVFVLGELTQRGRSVVPMKSVGLSLGEALAQAGGINPLTAQPKGVFVMRASLEERGVIQVFQLDLENAGAYVLADAFPLRPRDYVYVTASGAAQWNRVVDDLLPTIRAPEPAKDDTEPFVP